MFIHLRMLMHMHLKSTKKRVVLGVKHEVVQEFLRRLWLW
jgi:hypothetical protein